MKPPEYTLDPPVKDVESGWVWLFVSHLKMMEVFEVA